MEPVHMQLSQSKFNVSVMQPCSYFEASFNPCLFFFFYQAISRKPSHTRKWKRVPSSDVALEFLYTLPLYISSCLSPQFLSLLSSSSYFHLLSTKALNIAISPSSSPTLPLSFPIHNYQCHWFLALWAALLQTTWEVTKLPLQEH